MAVCLEISCNVTTEIDMPTLSTASEMTIVALTLPIMMSGLFRDGRSLTCQGD